MRKTQLWLIILVNHNHNHNHNHLCSENNPSYAAIIPLPWTKALKKQRSARTFNSMPSIQNFETKRNPETTNVCSMMETRKKNLQNYICQNNLTVVLFIPVLLTFVCLAVWRDEILWQEWCIWNFKRHHHLNYCGLGLYSGACVCGGGSNSAAWHDKWRRRLCNCPNILQHIQNTIRQWGWWHCVLADCCCGHFLLWHELHH